MINRGLKIILIYIFVFLSQAQAEIDIVITSGMDNARPVAVLPFSWKGITSEKMPQDIATVIAADLRRSGRFNPMPRHLLVQKVTSYSDIDLLLWREKGVEAVVVGTMQELDDGRVKIGYELIDVFLKQQDLQGEDFQAEGRQESDPVNLNKNLMDSYTATVELKNARFHAHRIADRIYQELTGEKGAFATKIAYVSVNKKKDKPYRLMVSDSDGYAPQTVFASTQAIMSPSWSPDAKKLAYVSFENGRSEVFVQDLYLNSRLKVASFEGINSAPSFSPNGRMLALTLSRDGNPEIYILDLTSRRFSRITNNVNTIETEPSWSHDGQSLLFTSDRGGGPQIYKQSLASSKAERVTWEGNYNASAAFTPDGKTMVLINRTNGIFHVAVQDVESNTMLTLTKTSLDESPSLAPNGSMVIYATVYRNKQVLSVVSTDGRFKARLPSRQGEVKAPAWSPYLN